MCTENTAALPAESTTPVQDLYDCYTNGTLSFGELFAKSVLARVFESNT